MTTNLVATQTPNRKATIARMIAVVASFALVSSLIVSESRAAFTATTANPDNAFNAATIALTDSKGGTAMFAVTAMVPGEVATGCITVTYTGTADPAAVKLYQNAYSESDGATDGALLDTALTFDIDRVDNCTDRNKVADVNAETLLAMAAHTNYTNGIGTGWDPAAGTEARSFLFTTTFTSAGNPTDNTRIGDTVSNLVFTWETQAGS